METINEYGTIHIEPYYGSLGSMLKRFDRYARRDCFQGQTVEEFELWRKDARKLLAHLLGVDKLERPAKLEYDLLESTELPGGIVREKLLLQTDNEGLQGNPFMQDFQENPARPLTGNRKKAYMPVYILIPPKERIKGVFLALPGHRGAGKYSVAGRYDIPAVKEKIDFFHYDYGMKLCELGYVAVCPDCRGFGERRDEVLFGDTADKFIAGSCRNLANMAIPMGLTVIGLCVYDYMVLIDYLYERGEWDLTKLGCLGFSGGGMQTMYLSALDDRISQSVISGYFYGFRDSLMILNDNCSCNYVPGLWEHFDMGDILSLFAPKPVLIQSCRNDHLNGPRGLVNVTEQLAILKNNYALFGAIERIVHDIREGEHCFHVEPLAGVLATFQKYI